MIMGLFGAPKSPIVEAMGIAVSMWVACRSPLASESRIGARLAPLLTVELIPYFLKSPFSWAITIGEQSVSAIMPNLRSVTSGPSFGESGPETGPLEDGGGGAAFVSQPPITAAPARPVTAVERNFRRPTL